MIQPEITRNFYHNWFRVHFPPTKKLIQFLRWIDMMIDEKITWDRFIYVIEYVDEDFKYYWNCFVDSLE